ncbi:uncharacterized protein [Argopecten irradians]|uniref:uncharacterized protein n=1 Tax=Argopecten irradians TaxID=31199 RepID=UPI003723A3FD
MKNGYDEPPKGLDSGMFYVIHIISLVAMTASFTCASTIMVMSAKQQKVKKFYDRNKSERLVVYAAACDASFNLVHSTEHIQMLVTRNYITPKDLCKFHAFMTLELGLSQVVLVIFVAVNVFCMMFLHKDLSFGKYDWKLTSTVILAPFFLGVGILAADKFGPNGAFCFFDSVTARQLNFYLTTLPLCLVLVNNAILYGLSWYRIRVETKRLADTLGTAVQSKKRTHIAAKNMFLFLISYFVQWWALSVYGIWIAFGEGPIALYVVNIFFSNAGGVWNGIVFIIIRRRRRMVDIKLTKTVNDIQRKSKRNDR